MHSTLLAQAAKWFETLGILDNFQQLSEGQNVYDQIFAITADFF